MQHHHGDATDRHPTRRLGGIAAIALLALITSNVAALPVKAAESLPRTTDLAGTVALSDCSGSLVAPPQASPQDHALVMSNGHCLESGMPEGDQVIVDKSSTREFSLLDGAGDSIGTLTAEKLAYATMADTDVSLYRLNQSYQEIIRQHGVEALPLSAERPQAGTAITIASGYWKQTYSCQIDGFASQMREGDYVWKDSIRYTPECETKGGTSGSPVIDDATGEVVGVNNTANEDGEECTMNNPCEVNKNGETSVLPERGYGQQSYLIADCVDEHNVINVELPDCALPKP